MISEWAKTAYLEMELVKRREENRVWKYEFASLVSVSGLDGEHGRSARDTQLLIAQYLVIYISVTGRDKDVAPVYNQI